MISLRQAVKNHRRKYLNTAYNIHKYNQSDDMCEKAFYDALKAGALEISDKFIMEETELDDIRCSFCRLNWKAIGCIDCIDKYKKGDELGPYCLLIDMFFEEYYDDAQYSAMEMACVPVKYPNR